MLDGLMKMIFGDPNKKELQGMQPLVDKINELEKKYEGFSSAKLAGQTEIFKQRLQNGETLDDILP